MEAGARARRRISRILVVVSQSNRNFDHFRRSRMRRGLVVSSYTTYRSLVMFVVEEAICVKV